MRFLNPLRFRLATLFRRSRMNEEIEDELRSHIQHRADDLERSGLPRREAERRARVEFGGQARFKEEIHEAAGAVFIESAFQDFRLAFRLLRKSPSFTLVAIATLAIAIGANAVAFGALNAVILRSLDVPQPQSLYALQPRLHDTSLRESYPDYIDFRDRNTSFDGLTAFNIVQAGLDSGQNPAPVWLEEVAGNYFDVLRVHPYLGRVFHGSDEHGPNSAPYAVISYA